MPFSERFAAAVRAGFEAVEFLFPYAYAPADIARWLGDGRLDAIMFNLPAGQWDAGERGLAALPGREIDFLRSLDLAIDYARQLGVSRLHAMAGLSAAGANRMTLVANLRAAAEKLAIEGIDLLIETISPLAITGYFLDDQNLAVSIVEEVGCT